MDVTDAVLGAAVYLPVHVKGALVYIGDIWVVPPDPETQTRCTPSVLWAV